MVPRIKKITHYCHSTAQQSTAQAQHSAAQFQEVWYLDDKSLASKGQQANADPGGRNLSPGTVTVTILDIQLLENPTTRTRKQ